jgi:hypothetical protein
MKCWSLPLQFGIYCTRQNCRAHEEFSQGSSPRLIFVASMAHLSFQIIMTWFWFSFFSHFFNSMIGLFMLHLFKKILKWMMILFSVAIRFVVIQNSKIIYIQLKIIFVKRNFFCPFLFSSAIK